LPQLVQDNNDQDGGRWINTKRLRLWTEDPAKLGVNTVNFDKAYAIAENDTDNVCLLATVSAFQKGSL